MPIFGKFTYNGISSESFGNLILCTFDSQTERKTQAKETYKGETNPWRDIPAYYADKYAVPLTAALTLAKANGAPFSGEEARKIRSWLISPTGYRLLEIDDGNGSYEDIEFFTKFTASRERVYTGNTDALSFDLECNAPYGHTKERKAAFSPNSTITIRNDSDDTERDCYPVIHITPAATGTVKIVNEAFPGEVMQLKVLSKNNVVVDNQRKTISDDLDRFDFANDFNSNLNFTWIRLAHGTNKITVTGDCSGYFTYRFIRMVGIE